jgi:hypothetical protein
MASDGVVKLALFGIVGGAIFVWKAYHDFQKIQLIQNTPTSTVRGLAMGFAEVEGEVVPMENKILVSPLTNQKCVYYHYTIEERRGSGKSEHWATIRGGKQYIPFFIEDKTGRVVVDARGAELSIPDAFSYDGSFGKAPKIAQDFCKREKIDGGGIVKVPILGSAEMFKRMRFQETHIVPGTHLFVLGTAQDNPDVDEGTSAKGHEDIVIGKGDQKNIFYISNKSEKETLASLNGWKLFGAIGILAFFGGLAILFLSAGIL